MCVEYLKQIAVKAAFIFVVCVFAGSEAKAQEFTSDTLRLNVFFRRDISKIDPSYRNNGRNLQAFRDEINRWLEDSSAIVRTVIVRTSASPEGPTLHNKDLARWRAESIDRWLTDSLRMDPGLFRYQPIGEDWDGLMRMVSALDTTWKEQVLEIIRNTPEWVTKNGRIIDSRKSRLMNLQGGRVWQWLDEHIFPDLRAGGGVVSCVIYHRVAPPRPDTVYVKPPAPSLKNPTSFIRAVWKTWKSPYMTANNRLSIFT